VGIVCDVVVTLVSLEVGEREYKENDKGRKGKNMAWRKEVTL
jgi:hypothetical protein